MRCAGFNNVDIKTAYELGIAVVRVPAYSPYAVAEHAMGLLMSLNRRYHRAYNRIREGNFSLDGLLGFRYPRQNSGHHRHREDRSDIRRDHQKASAPGSWLTTSIRMMI
jgi:lactate dehydrogenase-like 2-hydroxyacid dehydrogenase